MADDLGQDQQPQPGAELQHQGQLGGDQRRRAPLDLHHRPEQVVAVGRWEDLVQVAEDLGGVADRVLGEQHAVEGVVLEPGAQHVLVEGAVERQQPADAGQPEAERQRDGLEALGGDDDQQRKAAGVGRAGGWRSDRWP